MPEKIEAGIIVEGKVVKTKPFGVIVSLPDNSQGLVHISQISTGFVQNITDHVNVGDVVKVKVLTVDRASGKISLSIKDASDPRRKPRDDSRPAHGDAGQRPAQAESFAPAANTFEDKLKEWLKASNERQAGLNKRNKRR